jgi:hypothetical protein
MSQTSADPVSLSVPLRRDRTLTGFVAGLGIVLLVLAVGAFWPQYLAKPLRTLDVYTHAHALIGVAWMLLVIAQPLAIRSGARALHRVLGRASYVVAPAFVVSGILLVHRRLSVMDAATFAKEAYFLYLPLAIGILFAVAAGLGFLYRRQMPLHARFMAATALLLIDPVVVRVLFFSLPPLPGPTTYQFITFLITDLLFVALVLGFIPRAPRPAPLWRFLAFMVVVQALWFTFALTPTWFAFAQWFIALPLT